MEPEVLFDKLASLDSPLNIAEFCREQRITGATVDETSCVLARLFMRETGYRAVKVSGEHIEWSLSIPYDYDWHENVGWGHRVPLTEAMQSFVRLFDSHHFPDLVDPLPNV